MGKHLLGLADLLCVPWIHCFPLDFPAQPALSAPISVQTFSVTLWLALIITVKTLARCYPFSESEKQRPRSGKLVTWDKTSPVPSPPGLPALTPVSLAQTFAPAYLAAPWCHRELISACPQVMSPKPASTIFPSSVNGDPVHPPPHPRHHSLL